MTEQHLDVAVIDGGIFLEHEDLSDNYRTFIQGISEPRDEPTFAKHRSWNFESDTYEQYDSHFFQRLSDTNRKLYQYYFGHGTAVAHILTTCMPQCRILSLKMPFDFMLDESEIEHRRLPLSKIRAQLEERFAAKRALFGRMKLFLLSHKVLVANCSWTERYADMRAEVETRYPALAAEELDQVATFQLKTVRSILEDFFLDPRIATQTFFTVAAGNNNQSLDEHPVYPAVFNDHPHILTIGGTTREGEWWVEREDFGANWSPRYVDICTQAQGFRVAWGKDTFQTKSGTSLATPVITALVLAILRRYPKLRPEELKPAVLQLGRSIKGLETRVRNGLFFDALATIPGLNALLPPKE